MKKRKNRKKAGRRIAMDVSVEAIHDFSKLSTGDRLHWLDEARSFIEKTLSEKQLREWEKNREWLNRKAA